MKIKLSALLFIALGALALNGIVHAERRSVLLVTEEEARQPDATAPLRRFGSSVSTDGPVITFNKPTYGSEIAKPVSIDISFGQRLAPVDLSSLRVTYLKFIPIDITDRVRDYASARGIKIDNADLPAGSHKVRFSIKDSEDRLSEEILKITIIDE